MVARQFRVRFAAGSKYQRTPSASPPANMLSKAGNSEHSFCMEGVECDTNKVQHEPILPGREPKRKSRFGCRECKQRRVKCDEVFPVCLRCQRRGSLCLSAPPPARWKAEVPWMIQTDTWSDYAKPNKRLLEYWLEKTCRMMCLVSDNNPLSYPLLEHLPSTPSLVHAVQSISAGQLTFFESATLTECLTERGLAMQLLQREVRDQCEIKPSSLLTVFLLGISGSWNEEEPICYGKEHLLGGQTLLEKLLVKQKNRDDPIVQLALGWYIYWDMCCSFIASPEDLPRLDSPVYLAAVQDVQDSFHPMVGFSGKLMSLMSRLGRYCRHVIEYGEKDMFLEAAIESELLAWKPMHQDATLVDLSNSYRNAGLIMLYSICGRGCENIDSNGDAVKNQDDLDARIQFLAMEALSGLFQTPIDAPCFSYHSIPLLVAGAELRKGHGKKRVKVISRFKALYSTNRIAVNMWAIKVLEELWDLRDCGIQISWVELVLSNNWKLSFA